MYDELFGTCSLFVSNICHDLPLSVVCRVLNVTQWGFHLWRNRERSTRGIERDRLRADIRTVFDAHRGRYVAPRLTRVRRAQHGYAGSENRIKALMRAMGLRAAAGRKFKGTTDSAHALPIAANLLGQDFNCDSSADSTSHLMHFFSKNGFSYSLVERPLSGNLKGYSGSRQTQGPMMRLSR